jgi:hypothetical protein
MHAVVRRRNGDPDPRGKFATCPNRFLAFFAFFGFFAFFAFFTSLSEDRVLIFNLTVKSYVRPVLLSTAYGSKLFVRTQCIITFCVEWMAKPWL